ncbi:MAG TPA: nucleotidyltransferase domain-containing protein [Bryobacteraceae bacterium]|jgi:hypothetical protein
MINASTLSRPVVDIPLRGYPLADQESQKTSIRSLILFGSRARGDHVANSDTDLLLITSESKPRHRTVHNISLSLYPAVHLLDKARAGDLFVCHLVKEGKVLSDESSIFENVCRSFRLRNSYMNEISSASELGWFLVRHGRKFENAKIVNRRIAWCVRTTLIARSAEARQPVFSASALERFAGSPIVGRLISQKNETTVDETLNRDFETFLITWGGGDISIEKTPGNYLDRFEQTSNVIALQTFRHGWRTPKDTYI